MRKGRFITPHFLDRPAQGGQGPLLGSFITKQLGWHWIFYLTFGLLAGMYGLGLLNELIGFSSVVVKSTRSRASI